MTQPKSPLIKTSSSELMPQAFVLVRIPEGFNLEKLTPSFVTYESLTFFDEEFKPINSANAKRFSTLKLAKNYLTDLQKKDTERLFIFSLNDKEELVDVYNNTGSYLLNVDDNEERVALRRIESFKAKYFTSLDQKIKDFDNQFKNTDISDLTELVKRQKECYQKNFIQLLENLERLELFAQSHRVAGKKVNALWRATQMDSIDPELLKISQTAIKYIDQAIQFENVTRWNLYHNKASAEDTKQMHDFLSVAQKLKRATDKTPTLRLTGVALLGLAVTMVAAFFIGFGITALFGGPLNPLAFASGVLAATRIFYLGLNLAQQVSLVVAGTSSLGAMGYGYAKLAGCTSQIFRMTKEQQAVHGVAVQLNSCAKNPTPLP